MSKRQPVIAMSDEALAASAPDLVAFSLEDARRVARLAFLITCASQRRKRPLDPQPRWEEMPPERQAAAAAGAFRVVQALMLLGWIDPPETADAPSIEPT